MSTRSEQELVRIEKLKALRAKEYPFPNDVKVSNSTADVIAAPATEGEGTRYNIAGRIVQLRHMGKASFVHVLDGSGKLQLYVKQDNVGAETYNAFKDLDIGDIVEARGYPFVTKTGEKSLFVENIRLLTKCLIPLPEKFHGLTDTEARYRYRYVDLIANPEVRATFKKRAEIIRHIRRFLDDRKFLEVETPVLHYIPGGAEARPFKTHYNALGCDMFLRIALELPLKKLVVGGLERVYEISRVFRNEGISKKHNPEFTMLEFYQAYATFEDFMTLTEEMLSSLVQEVCGSMRIKFGEHEVDFKPPWRRISMVDSVYEIAKVPRSIDAGTLNGLKQVVKEHGLEAPKEDDWGRYLDCVWGHLVEPKLIDPIFIIHHPYSISPLARKNLKDPKLTDRFELIVAGMEIANAFSELNDPEDQRERFIAQAERKASGFDDSTDVDEDFLRALEYGLPPTAGEGIGIDRLTMLLTDSHSIRDVVLFPQLKPKEEE